MPINRGVGLFRGRLRTVEAAGIAWGLALSMAGCATSVTSANPTAGATPRISFARTTNWRTSGIPGPASATDASLTTIGCRAETSCVAGGTFFTSTPDSPDAFTVSYNGGKWAPAKALIMPAGTKSSQLNGLACVASGPCLAVGTYTTSAGPTYGFVAEQSRGRWAPAGRLPLPRNYSIGSLNGVTCKAPGDCLAVGSIYMPRHGEMPMIVAEVSGKWRRPSVISPPAKPTPRYGGDQLWSVACSRTGSCVAVGEYNVTAGPSQLVRSPMITTESHGRWLPARGVQVPADIARITDAPGVGMLEAAGLRSVSCVPHGGCLATGTYLATQARYRGLAVSELHGRWSPTQDLTAIPGTTVACNIAYCLIAGGAVPASAGTAATTVPYTRGRWGQITEIRPPADANHSAALGHQFEIAGVVCFAGGRCIAVGSYMDKSGHRDPVVATRS